MLAKAVRVGVGKIGHGLLGSSVFAALILPANDI